MASAVSASFQDRRTTQTEPKGGLFQGLLDGAKKLKDAFSSTPKPEAASGSVLKGVSSIGAQKQIHPELSVDVAYQSMCEEPLTPVDDEESEDEISPANQKQIDAIRSFLLAKTGREFPQEAGTIDSGERKKLLLSYRKFVLERETLIRQGQDLEPLIYDAELFTLAIEGPEKEAPEITFDEVSDKDGVAKKLKKADILFTLEEMQGEAGCPLNLRALDLPLQRCTKQEIKALWIRYIEYRMKEQIPREYRLKENEFMEIVVGRNCSINDFFS